MLEVLVSLITDPEAVATLVTALIAFGLGVAGFYSQRRLHRREYTLGVLGHSLTNSRIMDGKNLLRRMTRDGSAVEISAMTAEDVDKIVDVLNYYEFICNAYFDGQLDKKTVIDQMAGSLLLTYGCCEDYIKTRRERRGRPKTYVGIEKMADHIKRYRL